jgi:hypothetical protein
MPVASAVEIAVAIAVASAVKIVVASATVAQGSGQERSGCRIGGWAGVEQASGHPKPTNRV